ncbi:hypothetical protein V6N12_069352 [Hibiscus sabdariffa]|uniref:Uncharacterized protein n=1 Tax=Hibiscus sabdariffa TaxID=183260 RepID=A0ABR2FDL5_9ROSI
MGASNEKNDDLFCLYDISTVVNASPALRYSFNTLGIHHQDSRYNKLLLDIDLRHPLQSLMSRAASISSLHLVIQFQWWLTSLICCLHWTCLP